MTNTHFESEIAMQKATPWLRLASQLVKGWSELIVVVFLIMLYLGYGEYQHSNRMQLINEVKVNDFYFVDYHLIAPSSDGYFRYISLKVSSIDRGLITFKLGNIGHSEQVSISEHVKFDAALRRNFFREKDLVVSQKTVFSWADTGILYDIARPQNIYINGWIVMFLSDLSSED